MVLINPLQHCQWFVPQQPHRHAERRRGLGCQGRRKRRQRQRDLGCSTPRPRHRISTRSSPRCSTRINDADAIAIDDTAGTGGDAIVSATGKVNFTDVDLTDTHTVSITPTPVGGQVFRGSLVAVVSEDSTGDGAGAIQWTYTVADGALNDLKAGETLTQTYTLTVSDGLATDSKVVTITIVGGNDAPTAGGQVTTAIYGTDRHE